MLWRLGRQISYVGCLGPGKTEARATAWALDNWSGEQKYVPGACVPRTSVEFSIF